jgi:hypothetical protein
VSPVTASEEEEDADGVAEDEAEFEAEETAEERGLCRSRSPAQAAVDPMVMAATAVAAANTPMIFRRLRRLRAETNSARRCSCFMERGSFVWPKRADHKFIHGTYDTHFRMG